MSSREEESDEYVPEEYESDSQSEEESQGDRSLLASLLTRLETLEKEQSLPYKYTQCPNRYSNPQSLSRHKSGHRRENYNIPAAHRCVCGKESDRKDHIDKHKLVCKVAKYEERQSKIDSNNSSYRSSLFFHLFGRYRIEASNFLEGWLATDVELRDILASLIAQNYDDLWINALNDIPEFRRRMIVVMINSYADHLTREIKRTNDSTAIENFLNSGTTKKLNGISY